MNADFSYDHVRLTFADGDSSPDYVLPRHVARELVPQIDEYFCPGIPLDPSSYLDLADPKVQSWFPGLSAQSFALIMRMDAQARDASLKFTQESLDKFLRAVVEEGLKTGKPVLGCTTPLSLALTLATILGNALFSPVANQLMELATTNDYVRATRVTDLALVRQFKQGLYGVFPIDEAFMRAIGRQNFALLKEFVGHDAALNALGWSPNGAMVASAAMEKIICVWRVSDGVCICRLVGHAAEVNTVAWSPDGRSIASGGDDGAVIIWKNRTKRVLKGHDGQVDSVTWSPDSKLVASGSHDNTVRIWDAITGECIKVLNGHTDHVRSVAWSPDGKLLASASRDATVRIWNVATWECVQPLIGHAGPVHSVAWMNDCKHVVSGSYDEQNSMRQWDVTTGICVQACLKNYEEEFRLQALSPNGKLLAGIGDDGHVVGIYGMPRDLRSLDQNGQWQMLVCNARTPFAHNQITCAVAKAIRATACAGVDAGSLTLSTSGSSTGLVVSNEPIIVALSRGMPWQEFRLVFYNKPIEGRYFALAGDEPASDFARRSSAQSPKARKALTDLMRGTASWQEVQTYYSQHRLQLPDDDSLLAEVSDYIASKIDQERLPHHELFANDLCDLLAHKAAWTVVQKYVTAYHGQLSNFPDLVAHAEEYVRERCTGASSSGSSSGATTETSAVHSAAESSSSSRMESSAGLSLHPESDSVPKLSEKSPAGASSNSRDGK
jgi:hypothetical protein